MKRLLFASMMVLAASCGKKAKGESCGADQKGDTRCVLTTVERCDGEVWKTQEECASSGLVCVSALGVTPGCGEPALEGEACRRDSECADGMNCSIAGAGPDGACLPLCTPGTSATDCAASEVCALSEDGTDGVCAALVDTGNACIDDPQCPPDEVCHWFRDDPIGALVLPLGACALSCPLEEVGTGQASCPAGLDCLPSPFRVDPQSGDASCSRDEDCDVAAGYTCQDLVEGRYCARPLGVCGHALPMIAEVPADPTTIPDSERCARPFQADQTDYRYFCGVTDPTATVQPLCMGVFADDPFEGVCVALCGEADVCGTGYVCFTPPIDTAVAWETQKDSFGNDVTCIKTGTPTCAPGYTCQTLVVSSGRTGDYCGKPSAVCARQ